MPKSDKPKLTLVPTVPDLPLSGPCSRRWPDGSELHVTENGILLIEGKEKYVLKRSAPHLSLVTTFPLSPEEPAD